MAILTTGCDWPVTLCADAPGDPCDGCPDYASLSAAMKILVDRAAVEHLWRWTGKQFGTCEFTIRPCREDCCSPCLALDRNPTLVGEGSVAGYWPQVNLDGWTNISCNRCGDSCSCSSISEVLLPGPIHEVTEVLIDGIPLLPVEYRVDNHRRLVRVPWTQNAGTDPTLVGQNTFDFIEYGQWKAQAQGWSGSTTLPTSEAVPAGDIAVLQWPPTFAARGQYLRIWVPAFSTFSIDTPERGVTISKTNHPNANGVHDDTTGLYGGGQDGTEYVIRFDGLQSVTLTTTFAGVEIREMGFSTQGGNAEWPTCQEMNRPSHPGPADTDDAVGTWEVTYERGIPVPAGGQIAAGLLACEFSKAACGSSECALPARVQSITRQGVTAAFASDLAAVWDRGETGIPFVDSWLASVTQPRRQFGARVFSPDLPRRRQTTFGG